VNIAEELGVFFKNLKISKQIYNFKIQVKILEIKKILKSHFFKSIINLS